MSELMYEKDGHISKMKQFDYKIHKFKKLRGDSENPSVWWFKFLLLINLFYNKSLLKPTEHRILCNGWLFIAILREWYLWLHIWHILRWLLIHSIGLYVLVCCFLIRFTVQGIRNIHKPMVFISLIFRVHNL